MEKISYHDFKENLRELNPKLTCKQCKEIYYTVYPEERRDLEHEPNTIGIIQPYGVTLNIPNTIASCKPAMPSEAKILVNSYLDYLINPPVINNQEGEKPMCYKCNAMTSVIATSAPVPIEATQRDFATARVNQIREQHFDKLREQFFMDAEKEPKNARDLIKAIKEDAFSLDEKTLNQYDEGVGLGYYQNTFGIRWGKNKPDKAGFEKAETALKVEAQEVIDAATLSPADGLLQLLKDFQGWTYSV